MESGIYFIVVCPIEDIGLKRSGVPSNFEKYPEIDFCDLKYFKSELKKLNWVIYSQHELKLK